MDKVIGVTQPVHVRDKAYGAENVLGVAVVEAGALMV
jgi:hypothetical protein